jgi:hypothetical protein
MLDSAKFHEVYNSTGEILQNVPPAADVTGIIAALLILGTVFFLGTSKKIGIINLNFHGNK